MIFVAWPWPAKRKEKGQPNKINEGKRKLYESTPQQKKKILDAEYKSKGFAKLWSQKMSGVEFESVVEWHEEKNEGGGGD